MQQSIHNECTAKSFEYCGEKVERELDPADYEELANLYRLVRVELNSLYDLLHTKERGKYEEKAIFNN